MIKRYVHHRGGPSTRTEQLRVLLPVAFPEAAVGGADPWDCLSNDWTFVSCALDTSSDAASARLHANARYLSVVRDSAHVAACYQFSQEGMPALPVKQQQELHRALFEEHALVFGNIPGPSEEVFVFGQQVRALQVVFQTLIPHVFALSLNGMIYMNMVADPDVLPEVETLPNFFIQELAELGLSFGVAGDPV
mmetsp:Transcript_13831/g.31130  ORF Transcript_13831/g.31130 Transcript_13831/m.31130 type:complete len:193 (+) Transcript_13831:1541-2119(+)